MSKKIIIISIITLTLFFISLAGYYFLIQTNENVSNGEPFSFRQFWPFGGETTPVTPTEEEPIIEPETPSINFAAKLRKIWSEPVAGAYIYDTNQGSFVRFVEKATGHVYEVELFSPEIRRISNTTIPKVYEATWMNNSSFVAQYLEDDNEIISTYIVTINPSATSTVEGTSSGRLLGQSISDIAVGTNRIFYLEQLPTASRGIISNFTNSNPRQIWSSPIKELLPQDINTSTLSLQTKPYPGIDGFLYFINTSNSSYRKILGNIPGLSTLVSPDASRIINMSQTSTNTFNVYTISNNQNITMAPVTFPEKCVWSRQNTTTFYCAVPKDSLDGSSLTSWYLGLVSFSDSIWVYNISNESAQSIESLANENIDLIKPILSPGERYMIFINKTDGSLWSLDLDQAI